MGRIRKVIEAEKHKLYVMEGKVASEGHSSPVSYCLYCMRSIAWHAFGLVRRLRVSIYTHRS